MYINSFFKVLFKLSDVLVSSSVEGNGFVDNLSGAASRDVFAPCDVRHSLQKTVHHQTQLAHLSGCVALREISVTISTG